MLENEAICWRRSIKAANDSSGVGSSLVTHIADRWQHVVRQFHRLRCSNFGTVASSLENRNQISGNSDHSRGPRSLSGLEEIFPLQACDGRLEFQCGRRSWVLGFLSINFILHFVPVVLFFSSLTISLTELTIINAQRGTASGSRQSSGGIARGQAPGT